MKLVFKVVLEKPKGDFQSTGSILTQDYVIGQRTVAPVGGLLCFDRLEDARYMAYSMNHEIILLCEADEKESIPLFPARLRAAYLGIPQLKFVEAYWNDPKEHNDGYSWPLGTVAYKSLRPVAKLDLWR